MAREVERLAVFTHDLFATPHDEANRAAVASVPAADLDFAGLALHADRKTVDKVLDKLRPHPSAPLKNERGSSGGVAPLAWSSAPPPVTELLRRVERRVRVEEAVRRDVEVRRLGRHHRVLLHGGM